MLAYSCITNGFIAIYYIVIYFILRSTYSRIIKTQSLVTDFDKSMIRSALTSLIILFISICQLYVGRIGRDILIFTGKGDEATSLPLFPLSKAVQIIGIVAALTCRLHQDIAAANQSKTTSNNVTLHYSLSLDSLDEFEEISDVRSVDMLIAKKYP